MQQVALGFDPALGGGTAIIACGVTMDRLNILDCEERFGLSRNEDQLTMIEEFTKKYVPSILVFEFDSQQKGLGQDDRLRAMADKHGFQIVPHLTRMEKQDEVFGVAQMNRSFLAREISIPWGDDYSKARMGSLVDQLRAWRPPHRTNAGILKRPPRQDLVMALWFVWRWWYKQVLAYREGPRDVARQTRPSWTGADRRR